MSSFNPSNSIENLLGKDILVTQNIFSMFVLLRSKNIIENNKNPHRGYGRTVVGAFSKDSLHGS